jgi:hypothetical protein
MNHFTSHGRLHLRFLVTSSGVRTPRCSLVHQTFRYYRFESFNFASRHSMYYLVEEQLFLRQDIDAFFEATLASIRTGWQEYYIYSFQFILNV